MKTVKLKTTHRKFLADTTTPVSIYLNLRDKFPNSILLESSDYHGHENSFSYICCEPYAHFTLHKNTLEMSMENVFSEKHQLNDPKKAIQFLSEFSGAFEAKEFSSKFISNGLFGYMGYDAVTYFEDIDFSTNEQRDFEIPDIKYAAYRYVIAIDHFSNELHIFEHLPEDDTVASQIESLVAIIKSKNTPNYPFRLASQEKSNLSDQEFVEIVQKGINHCLRGDVIQIVLSRRFQNQFKGDEFNVYRVLRSINPSPYLFYFDYGNFKIFGSSPEAQIVIKDEKATIFPIAGTFKRSGNDQEDAESAARLADDPKENSEHVMLVDLARNDLSRNSSDVEVETFKEVQFYSHVIHLVSKVTGKLKKDVFPVQLVADTFPAGTLSGAPKHMAMNLINKYENTRRGYYGGAIGFLGFNGDFNHAIMIRSFLSNNNVLYYQAGAGVVAKSLAESELQEVNNKLAALRKAMEMASALND